MAVQLDPAQHRERYDCGPWVTRVEVTLARRRRRAQSKPRAVTVIAYTERTPDLPHGAVIASIQNGKPEVDSFACSGRAWQDRPLRFTPGSALNDSAKIDRK
jgi:hypothetical protein